MDWVMFQQLSGKMQSTTDGPKWTHRERIQLVIKRNDGSESTDFGP